MENLKTLSFCSQCYWISYFTRISKWLYWSLSKTKKMSKIHLFYLINTTIKADIKSQKKISKIVLTDFLVGSGWCCICATVCCCGALVLCGRRTRFCSGWAIGFFLWTCICIAWIGLRIGICIGSAWVRLLIVNHDDAGAARWFVFCLLIVFIKQAYNGKGSDDNP